jgi:hypothetical protein
MVSPIQQSLHLGFGTGGDKLNGAIGPIADVTDYSQTLSFSLSAVAKPDSLHYAVDNDLNVSHPYRTLLSRTSCRL